jgi:hypothetical protein
VIPNLQATGNVSFDCIEISLSSEPLRVLMRLEILVISRKGSQRPLYQGRLDGTIKGELHILKQVEV